MSADLDIEVTEPPIGSVCGVRCCSDWLLSSLCCSPTATLLMGICTLAQGLVEVTSPCPLARVGRWCACRCEAGAYLITGANRGIGYGMAKVLCQHGVHVILLCRSAALGERARARLVRATGNKRVECAQVDLSELASVAAFVGEFRRRELPVRALLNNAGAICDEAVRVNHVGHMALTVGLLDALMAGGATIVNVASCAHWLTASAAAPPRPAAMRRGAAWDEYSASKLANALFTQALQRRLRGTPGGTRVRVVSYHPGVMATDLWRGTDDGATEERGRAWARTMCACAAKHPLVSGAGAAALAAPRCTAPRCRLPAACCGEGGGYYQQLACCCVVPVRARPAVYDSTLQLHFWEASAAALRAHGSATLTEPLGRLRAPAAGEGYPLCSPAFPCTECCTLLPVCPCIACLC
jgi:NAD(P)-dependent dehydrogenase (short-subunit alcohol dehydrogenase family)